MKHLIIAVLLVTFFSGECWARAKTDIIWLSNGDRLTGEIKKLEHGKLTVGTNSLGEIRVEWDDIARIQSAYEFQFERTDGQRVTGIIEDIPEQSGVTLTNKEQTVIFAHQNIVRISQIEDDFWQRLKGSLSFGYSFTRASNVAQGNLGFRASHRTEIRSFTLEGTTVITSDQAGDATEHLDVSFNMTRFRKDRWFNSYEIGMESSDQQGLRLRSSFGAGLGRYLVQTNTSELSVLAGLLASSENRVDEDASQENLEGALGISYSRYIFDDPTVDLVSSFTYIPSITDSGRNRAKLDIKLRWEIYSDLFWELNYYNSDDSTAGTGEDSTSDYSIVTSLGWSY
jgi:hypothetical protein